MSKNTLCDKVWDSHIVGILPDGRIQLYVGKHQVHEVTSPQAFDELRDRKIKVRRPDLTFATMDHIIPTACRDRPFNDSRHELMASTLERNVKEFGITYFGPGSGKNGICHVVFPEQGVIWPGITTVCGDSHTSTGGAFGALAFGIQTTEVRDVLATQTIAMNKKPKVRRINVNGVLKNGVYAKDIALYLINLLGVKGGVGFAHEYGGNTIQSLGIEGRMTLCNLSIEGGSRMGYVNPDNVTVQYMVGRDYAPKSMDRSHNYFMSFASGKDAEYDDVVEVDAADINQVTTWGVNPSQSFNGSGRIPFRSEMKTKDELESYDKAMDYMGFKEGQEFYGLPIDHVFIGSCTNSRLTDLAVVADVLKGNRVKVSTMIVPGSEAIRYEAERLGFAEIFREAGAEWRETGCSMCLEMSPDAVPGVRRIASTSNRNFKDRQGVGARTHLMSPYRAAQVALTGEI